MTEKLGKLERADSLLREIWEEEDKNFTPWLARGKNLKLLARTIGMGLEFEEREKGVGPFSADILCKNIIDGSWVVIENQLERTDHKHLGQLLTYAAGLDAKTIIWIAKEFREEHRAALDRLNNITDENFNFFGLEVELWRIGDSLPAPKFNIVAKPNDWRKAKQYAMSEIQKLQYRYLKDLVEYIRNSGSKLLVQKLSRGKGWCTFFIGRNNNFWIGTVLNTLEQRIQVELCIYDSVYEKTFFKALEEDKEAIEQEIGFSLEWEELPKDELSKIILSKEANPANENDWPSQHKWLKETVEKFDTTFRPRIKELDTDDYNDVADEGEEI